MTALRTERTGADITVQIGEPEVALRAAQRGTVDFVVTSWVDGEVPEDLIGEKLWEEPMVLCASPHGPPDGDSITLAELRELPFVGVPSGVSFHRMIQDQLRRYGTSLPNPVIRLGHAEAIMEAVVANGWVSLSMGYMLRKELEAGRIRAVEIRDARLVEGIGSTTGRRSTSPRCSPRPSRRCESWAESGRPSPDGRPGPRLTSRLRGA